MTLIIIVTELIVITDLFILRTFKLTSLIATIAELKSISSQAEIYVIPNWDSDFTPTLTNVIGNNFVVFVLVLRRKHYFFE